jgi:hypothetical protein
MRKLLLAGLFLLFASPALAKRPPSPDTPRDFGFEARLFYRVVACAGTDPVDASIEKIVEQHCKWMAENIATFHKRYLDPAAAFFAKVRPSGLPRTVVYPFGGGDLVSALLTYPEATEVTTISLEHAGDPTRFAALTPKQLKKYLAAFRAGVRGLLINSDSESEKLKLLEKGPIPGQLAFHIVGAAIMGYEPVALKYFRVEDDGSIHYFTRAEVDSLGTTKAKRKKGNWVDTDWSVVYTNMELTLTKTGDASAPQIVHRHIAANLQDKAFDGSGLEKHLEAKGKVAAMTKAASYLLWMNSFSAIRDYLATHLVWMPSDTTGLPPRWAKKAGLEQTTYGRFTGKMFEGDGVDETAFVKLFAKQPYRKLTFRYGYRDVADHPHLVITQPKAAP